MDKDQVLRQELLALLKGGNAHMGFADAVSDFPMKAINTKVPNGSYTVWHLLEHIRIAQWDILDFVINPDHQSPKFPDGYWPGVDEKASPGHWKKTVKGFQADLKVLEKLVKDPQTDFFGPIPHAKDYTILREVLLAADHNAYHLGELVGLRRILNLKPIFEY
ncbi:MAG: DinB family protein [Deltaproteobacteria bacterium]|nr:DinB family protein [Deltaproteobacteria bacterium]